MHVFIIAIKEYHVQDHSPPLPQHHQILVQCQEQIDTWQLYILQSTTADLYSKCRRSREGGREGGREYSRGGERD